MFEHIEQLKAEWTDKYVVVDAAAPELARFGDATGRVKTVNMNGRCLVEFDQYNNIGWYDIDPSALTIVSGPRPKPEKPAAKPAAAKPAAAKSAAAKPAAAKPAAGATRASTADILAAARGKATGGAATKPSTADILAAARGKAAAPANPAKPAAAESAGGGGEPEAVEPASAVAEPAAADVVAKPAAAKAAGPMPTTVEGKIAWCREHDSKS
jgi:hypothetical protein